MGLTLAKIAGNTASVTFQYMGDSVTVDYYPARVTEKTVAQLQGLAKSDESNVVAGFEVLNLVLAGLPGQPGSGLLKSWDVYEDDAQSVMFPIDAARLAELPLMFRTRVIQVIMADIRPEAIAAQA